MHMFVIGIAVALASCAVQAPEENASKPDLDLAEMAATARREADVPALGLCVLRRGAKPAVAVSGVRMAVSETKVTPADAWHWGSISKSFTATLVARLVEKGVVSWEDTIGARLGDVVPDMRGDYRDVTFVHLLSHRSGIPANIPIERFAEFQAPPANPITDRLAWVKIALAQKPKGPKQETYEYSNSGYIVAGAMLEAATDRSWEDLMKKEVFAPLGLASAGFGPPRGSTHDAQPRGHRNIKGIDLPVPATADNPPALGPAGRIHMSLADMARFLNAHATRRSDFLSEATYKQLHTKPFGGIYALGWVVTAPEGRWHNGSNTMWYAEVAFNLTTGNVAAVVVNDGDIENVQPTVRALLQALMKKQQ
ncbi:MAG: beta-lactamase family protein [Planctomycetes bacterium]|nr:beta-lactamase family protein [Planctomycetota bacterium]